LSVVWCGLLKLQGLQGLLLALALSSTQDGFAQTQNSISSTSKAPAQTQPKAAAPNKIKPITPAPLSVAAPLSERQLELAQQVQVGRMPCELGAFVQVAALQERLGYFKVQLGKQSFTMAPVETSSGALRLEDPQSGAVWLQLTNKSMMVNSRLGQRLVDECMSPTQSQVSKAMEKNPPPSLLEPGNPPQIFLNSMTKD
jgi:hypothetical protein